MNEAQEHEALTGWLAEHDEPCPVCSYNLRGLAQRACPECAAPLRLGVTSPHAALGPWLLAVVAFSLALGFDGVMAAITLIAVVAAVAQPAPAPGAAMAPFLVFAGAFAALGAICGAGLWLMIARRRQWRTAVPDVQWARAGLIFGAVFVIHAVAGLVMAV